MKNLLNKIFGIKKTKSNVVVRFAPSPTGFLHIGGARTALFNYLFAKQNNGKFILRIEDTDKERSKKEWEEQLIEDLNWLGMKHDELFRQSDRVEIHKKYLKQLIDQGHAYISKEEVKEEGQRSEVIRFKNPNKVITINDLIKGEVKIDTTDLGDFVIAKSLDEPIFHLAVVVDDMEMGITHIIRAEEHLANTPRQILIQEALGSKRPFYAHIPLVLAEDKTKLSKRKHGETVSLTYYREREYLSEAIVNFIAFLGWNPGTEQEIFNIEELIKSFSLEKVQKGGAVFNVEKLRWYNKQYLKNIDKNISLEKIKSYLKNINLNEESKNKLSEILLERVDVYSDVNKIIEDGELAYFENSPTYEKEKLLWKKSPDLNESKEHLLKIKEFLEKLSTWSKDSIKDSIWSYAEEKGKGNVLWPFRYALSGRDQSPDPIEIADILGQKETLSRLDYAIQLINA